MSPARLEGDLGLLGKLDPLGDFVKEPFGDLDDLPALGLEWPGIGLGVVVLVLSWSLLCSQQ